MPRQDRKQEKKQGIGDTPRPPLGKAATVQDIQEELSFLRQKCNSLFIRGYYGECLKTIEDNLRFLYFKERWPENFFGILRLHQRCYPSLDKEQSHEDYLSALLIKNGIPFVFAILLRGSDSTISWTAEYFKDLAMISDGKGDREIALSYCDVLIKIDPGSANAYLVKGWILEDMGRGGEAVAMFQYSLELNSSNRNAMNSLAKHYLQSDPKQALSYIEMAIEQNPNDGSYFGLKAAILRRLGDREGAMLALEAGAKLDPYNADFPYQKAELYMEEDKRVAALPQYRMAIGLDEKHIPSLMRLVDFSSESQPDLALTYINTVISLEPQNKKASLIRAKILQRVGENDAAIKQYKALLELDPASHHAMGGLGALYLIQEDYPLAVSYLENAITLAPDVAQYHMDKARAHQRQQEQEAAIKEYKATLSLEKNNARAWAELGHLHAETQPKEALGYFTKAITYAPENAYYHTAKGELILGMDGDKTDALHCFNAASQLDPGNAALHARLGLLLEGVGNITSAVEHYKTAIGLDPGSAEVYYRLARLLLDTQPDMALSYINSAINLDAINGEYYYYKSKILTYLGYNQDAQEQLRKSIGRGSKDPEAMSELSDLMGGDSPRVALMYINRAIELSPNNTAYLCARAHLLYQLGQKGKAKEQYEKLLKTNPDQHEALFGMARLLAVSKDKKALEYFNRAIDNAPAELEYYAEKAAFLAQQEETYEEALTCYTTAISLNNQAWQVILQKAKLLDAHGDEEGARTEYRRVLLIYPSSAYATARMGVLLADLSPTAALVYLDHAVRLEPENYLHYAWRGKVLYSLGQEEAAIDECRMAITLGGDNADTYFTLAGILNGKMPEIALKYCLLAIEEDPQQAEYQTLCGDIYTELAEYAAAKGCYELAAQLDRKSHGPVEKLARIAYLEAALDAKERVEAALATRQDCHDCLFIKASILDEVEGDTAGALACVTQAVKLEPDSLLYREKLVELLQKRRAILRLPLEKHKLEKLRRKLEFLVEIPEPPVFTYEEEPEEFSPAPTTPISEQE